MATTPRVRDKADPIPLPELRERIEQLEQLRGIERARAARELTPIARATIAAAGDEGVWQATRPRGQMTYSQAAEALGWTDDGGVGQAVSDHNRRRSAKSNERSGR